MPGFYSKSVQAPELLKHQYFHCLVALDVWWVFFRKKCLGVQFRADYNLESMKTKSGIYIKNERCVVQQEIAPAYRRHFCLLVCHRQPIPSRWKMLYRKRIAQQKCFSVHLPENNARICSHFLSPMHPLAFKTVFSLHFYFTLFWRKRLLFQCILKGNWLLARRASVAMRMVEVWCVTESEIIQGTVVGVLGKQPITLQCPSVGLEREKGQSAGCFSQHYVK